MKKPKKKGGLRTFRYRGCVVTVTHPEGRS